MRSVYAIGAATTLAALLSCAETGDTAADDCARVVQRIRGLPNAVRVVNEVATAVGQVQIDYQSINAENIPVTGSASCGFAVSGSGPLELVEASIDGEFLGPGEVTAANRVLSTTGR